MATIPSPALYDLSLRQLYRLTSPIPSISLEFLAPKPRKENLTQYLPSLEGHAQHTLNSI